MFILNSRSCWLPLNGYKCTLEMSRHHSRYERDYRSGWDWQERINSCNNVNNTNCTSGIASTNSITNRPALLPLPMVPSHLLTAVTPVSTTASNEMMTSLMSSSVSSTTTTSKVGILLSDNTVHWFVYFYIAYSWKNILTSFGYCDYCSFYADFHDLVNKTQKLNNFQNSLATGSVSYLYAWLNFNFMNSKP